MDISPHDVLVFNKVRIQIHARFLEIRTQQDGFQWMGIDVVAGQCHQVYAPLTDLGERGATKTIVITPICDTKPRRHRAECPSYTVNTVFASSSRPYTRRAWLEPQIPGPDGKDYSKK